MNRLKVATELTKRFEELARQLALLTIAPRSKGHERRALARRLARLYAVRSRIYECKPSVYKLEKPASYADQ